MAEYDFDRDPDSRKVWQVGDRVWVGTTLYVVDVVGPEIGLKRHEPGWIRVPPTEQP